MTIDDLIPPHVTKAVADAGLHKIAGAMMGVPEVTIKEAVALIGYKAYLRRKEARAIVDGLMAYSALTNEKVADAEALLALGRRALLPALLGAGVAAVPALTSENPYERQKLPGAAITGGVLGGVGGLLHALYKLPPNVGQVISRAIP